MQRVAHTCIILLILPFAFPRVVFSLCLFLPPLVFSSTLLFFTPSVSHLPPILVHFSSSSMRCYFLWSVSICSFTLPLCIQTLVKGSLSLSLSHSVSHSVSLSLLSLLPSLSVFLLICLPLSLSLPPSLPPSHPHPYLFTHTWFILHITEASIMLLWEGKISSSFFIIRDNIFHSALSGCLFFPNSYTLLWIQS